MYGVSLPAVIDDAYLEDVLRKLRAGTFPERDLDADLGSRARLTHHAVAYAHRHRNKPGRHELLDRLTAAGADVNATARKGWTPLHEAVSRHPVDLGIVDRLLTAGANPNATARHAWTPLHELLESGHGKRSADPEVVARLIDGGADVNARDTARGTTPLNVAACYQPPEIVRLLLNAGAPIDGVGDNGHTALVSAALAGRADNCVALLEAGASLAPGPGRHVLSWLHEHRAEPGIVNLLKSWGRKEVFQVYSNGPGEVEGSHGPSL